MAKKAPIPAYSPAGAYGGPTPGPTTPAPRPMPAKAKTGGHPHKNLGAFLHPKKHGK